MKADRYTKHFDTYKHLLTMLYGVIGDCNSLRELVLGCLVNASKLSHLGIDFKICRSTLAEANARRDSSVFEAIYISIYERYSGILPDSRFPVKRLFVFDSTTITLFCDVLKGCDKAYEKGSREGKRKGGIKVHTLMKASEGIPRLVCLDAAAVSDGRHMRDIYATRLKDNVRYEVAEELPLGEKTQFSRKIIFLSDNSGFFYILIMTQSVEENDIDLSRLIARILHHKIIVVAIAILAFSGTFAYLKVAPKFYETTTKFVYQSSTKQSGNLAALAAIAGKSGSKEDDAYMEDIIKSADFLSQFTKRVWLITDTSRTADTLEPITLEDFWKIKIDSAANDRESLLQAIMIGKILKYKYIKYEQDKKTGVTSLTTQFEDPKLSYYFNIAMFEELNNTLLNKMHFKASENRKFIEERLIEVKSDLRRSEEILLRFKQQNRSWNDPSIQLQENRLLREVNLNQELALQLQKQYELAKIEEARDMPLLDVIESPRRALGHSKPKKKMVLALGLAGGIALGLMVALAFDLWRTERKNIMEQVAKAKKELG